MSACEDEEYRITPAQQAAASCTGALVTSFFVTPLDVVKIRLQLQQKAVSNNCFLYCNGLMDHICGCHPNHLQKEWFQRPGHFNGTLDAFIKISKHEGISSLWSGLGPTLVLAIPATIVYFVSYEQLRIHLLDAHRERLGEQVKQPYWIPLISGATARVVSVSIVSPLELIRTKMQSQKLSYFEVGSALKMLVKNDGVKGLWKGLLPTLLRDVPFSALYWFSYETIKGLYTTDQPSFLLSFIAGAVSGSVAASVTVPFDVVKTHQQIEFGQSTITGEPMKTRTTKAVIKDIYSKHGVRGLFAGIVPRLIKVAPACAIMISTFEYGKCSLVVIIQRHIFPVILFVVMSCSDVNQHGFYNNKLLLLFKKTLCFKSA
ncbi:probable mitochondrial glutathione transporter SLC25A40 isoform X3 [Aethina tumida]|uniref:probable mitochondrial glutathione transporter SLC25A40 isoform X3 n=1 Tax=Aethina tumida TaxID=116153 RepID=UPI00096AF72F|nr:probable mitochondrial glutathione transporter SLC25A40 isoform X3 [Aethina tumida]